MDPLNPSMNIVHRSLGNFAANTLGRCVAPDGTPATEVLSGIAETVFHKTVEYSTNLVGRVYSAHQERQFYSELESWFEEGAPTRNRKEAMNAIKDAYVNQREELDLSRYRLTSLPNCIGQLKSLKTLIAFDSRLQSLPDSIGNLTNLEELHLSHNRLETLPASIEGLTNLRRLNVSNNRLTQLPNSIGNLPNLQVIQAANTRLTSLPESIGNLPQLREVYVGNCRLTTLPNNIGNADHLLVFNLDGNPLRELPTSVLDLPPACSISLNGSEFSDQVLHRLQEITSAAGYNGPQISFSMGNGALDEELPSLDELFTRYFDLAGEPPKKFDFVENLSESQKVQLQTWLSRLSTIGNLRRAGESEKEFAQKVLSFVNQANQDEKFREVFLGILDGASATCGDRVALSLLHIGVAYQQATMDLSDPKKVADFLKRGPGALDILEKIARDKVLMLPMVDEIEVYLAYPVQLRETLNLPIDVDKMLYFACSSVTAQDLEGARQEVQNFLDDEEASLKFLIKQNIWVETLEKTYPKRYEEINNQRYDMLDDPATCDQAMDYYEQELIKLSREVLELGEK